MNSLSGIIIFRCSTCYWITKIRCNSADVTDEDLATYEVPREKYLQAFNEQADKSIITKDLFNRFLDQSPHKDRLKNEHDITPEDN